MSEFVRLREAIGVFCQAFLQESLKEFSEKRIITNSKEGRSVENKDFSAFVAELKQKSDIVDVIGSYVPVRQKGRSYWAACPFHHEKTPSFSISRNGQFYKCFGCGVSGDVIKFVEEYESVTFPEAIEILAKRVGMKVPSFRQSDETDLSAKKNRRDKLVALLKDAARFYNGVLNSDYEEKARNYLSSRGVGKELITKYALGYSPDYDSLPSYLLKKGYSAEEIKAAGVCGINGSGKLYDFLAERMIVPIISPSREVLAFGGRIIGADSGFAKYKNTQETEIFVKSRTLYNLNGIKILKQQGKLSSAVMTEGYMDVIGLGSYGIEDVCASMGTSLTLEQARLLKRYVREVYICYDGDSAGRNATVRGMDILAGEGLTVRVMSMPDGLDPDEFVRKFGKEAFLSLKNEALPLTAYKLDLLRRKYDMNAPSLARREENRMSFSREAGKIIAAIPDKIEREFYANAISSETGLSKEVISSAATGTENVATPKKPPLKLNAQQKALAFIAACAIAERNFADRSFLPTGYGETEDKVFSYIKEKFDAGEKPLLSELFGVAGGADDFVSAVTEADTLKPEASGYYADCVAALKRDDYDRKISGLRQSLRTLPPEKQLDVLREIDALVKERNSVG